VKQTVAILCSLDTKGREAAFLEKRVCDAGLDVFLIDLTTRGGSGAPAHAGIKEILSAAGLSEQDARAFSKRDWIEAVRGGLALLLPRLYAQRKFHAALAVGGLQNTWMATGGLRELPVGVPKVMLSTVACGLRHMEPFVGNKDVTLMHAVADLSGLNPVTEIVLANAAAAVIGMLRFGGPTLPEARTPMVGISAMGVVGGCSERVIRLLGQAGHSVVAFHSTGGGGRSLEEMIASGQIVAAVELSLHELICADVFHEGYALGAPGRLLSGAAAGIPMVVMPGGLDFIDYSAEEFRRRVDEWQGRGYLFHNAEVVHIKCSADEACAAASVVAERLNQSRGPVCVLLPLRGLRSDTGPGEALHDPAVDAALFEVLRAALNSRIRVVEIDANINDAAVSDAVVRELNALLAARGAYAGEL